MTRGVTLVRTVETPEYRQLVAQRFPNSIANFLFQNFPSPNPTSNIRDTGQPVAGLRDQQRDQLTRHREQPELHARRERCSRTAPQATARRDPRHRHREHSAHREDRRQPGQLPYRSGADGAAAAARPLPWDDRISDDKQTIVRDGFNQPITENGQNLTAAHTWIICSPHGQRGALRHLVARARPDRRSTKACRTSRSTMGSIGFGNLPTNPAVFAQKTFHWVDTVSMNQGNHGIKFGGEVRHVRDNSDFAVRRPGYPLLQHPRLREGRGAVGRHPRHRSLRPG